VAVVVEQDLLVRTLADQMGKLQEMEEQDLILQ
jgi:hypothetical protein